jgi:colanic acid/amylovoran biosynthesis glycosyltransferase
LQRPAFFYATFPRPTETFVRRELWALYEFGFTPKVYSIWRGAKQWEGIPVTCFSLWKLWSLIFWLPYWAWKKPYAFREILMALWSKPCPSVQNWNETFLGLGFALVEANNIAAQKHELLHGVWATMPATATLALSLLLDVPFTMGAHAYDLFRKGGDWLLTDKFKHSSMIRTSSMSSASRLFELGLTNQKVKVIRRGLSHWPVRKSFELSDHKTLKLISVGRLVEKKGYFYLLRILSSLAERKNCKFQMQIVGMGPLYKALHHEIFRYGLEEKVVLVGSKTEEQTRELFLQADAKLFCGIIAPNGDRDGIPNVIPEAMSAGCLILASHHAGASEAFIDGVSGFSLDPKDSNQWVKVLEEFAENPSSHEKIRKKARLQARERFDVRNTASFMMKNFNIINLSERRTSICQHNRSGL